MTRIALSGAALALLALSAGFAPPASAQQQPQPPEKTWESLKDDITGGKPLLDGSDLLALDAPMRAEDAAVVPITVRALRPQSRNSTIKAITLVVDENPAPLAATVSFGPGAATASFSTRLRINAYSYVRAIAEMEDGSLRMVKKFVKASGGCSAPALKDQDKTIAEMGQLRLRQFAAADAAAQDHALGAADNDGIEAQVMVRHPNYSGLQMDQITMLYIPAHYVSALEVKRGEASILKMEGGISLSENPSFRFVFRKEGAGELSVSAEDTQGKVFAKSWPVERIGS
jgi:sulfur-oxidizing protein SoxY